LQPLPTSAESFSQATVIVETEPEPEAA
jgi:hypothetical protein